MAKIVSKGCVLKATISASLTSIAQVNNIQVGESANEVVDAEDLDDSGVAVDKVNIGSVTQGDITFTGHYDPDLATDAFITDSIAAGAASFPIACSIVLTDSTPSSITFDALGFGMSIGMANKELVSKNGRIVTKAVTWP